MTEELREKNKKEASRLKIKTEELKETEQRREAESTRWEEEVRGCADNHLGLI